MMAAAKVARWGKSLAMKVRVLIGAGVYRRSEL
jgi:hypothetical protein